MEIADLLSLSGVSDDLKAGSKKQALQELSAVAAAQLAEKERTILDLLLARERLGSTGVGGGVAIPHARLEGLAKPSGLFARLREPIEFDAVDGQPVDLIFLLLAPETEGSDHLEGAGAGLAPAAGSSRLRALARGGQRGGALRRPHRSGGQRADVSACRPPRHPLTP